jgi:hypothetical protein
MGLRRPIVNPPAANHTVAVLTNFQNSTYADHSAY